MVLDDLSSPNKARDSQSNEVNVDEQLASPVDRLAATVADLVLFLPLLALAISPFARQAKEAQLIGGEEAWFMAIGSAIGTGALVFLVYQTFFVSVFSATPGKLAIGLRVHSLWSPMRPRPIEAFLRSLVWLLELCLLGLPWLAVFGNERRRPFHDRIADTVVLAIKKSHRVGRPTLPEMSMASGLQSAALALATLFLTLNVIQLKQSNDALPELAAKREEQGQLCPEVREAFEETRGGKTPSVADRLKMALTLFTTESIDTECLESEADFALWKNQDRELAYLAKALATSRGSTSQEQSNYMRMACPMEQLNPDLSQDASGVCAVVALKKKSVQVVTAEDKLLNEQQDVQADEILQKLSTVQESTPLFVRLLVIRRLMQRREYSRALSLIDSVNGSRQVGMFLSQQRAKALWHLGSVKEARMLMQASHSLLDSASKVEMARWFCFNEIKVNGCSPESRKACDILSSAVEKFEGWLLKSDIAVAHVGGENCRLQPQGAKRWAAIKQKVPTREAKLYVDALDLIERGKSLEAQVKLLALSEANGSETGALFLETNLRLTDAATTAPELNELFEKWIKLDPADDSWKPLGQGLMKKMTSLRAWDPAIKVGLRLSKNDPGDRLHVEMTAFAAFASGQKKLASGLLENLSRRPASEQESR